MTPEEGGRYAISGAVARTGRSLREAPGAVWVAVLVDARSVEHPLAARHRPLGGGKYPTSRQGGQDG